MPFAAPVPQPGLTRAFCCSCTGDGFDLDFDLDFDAAWRGAMPRISPAMLAGFLGRQARRGRRRPRGARRFPRRPVRARYARVPRAARLPVPLSTVMGVAGTGVHPLSTVMGAAGSVVVFGEGGGVWGTWNRGRDFPGPGAVPGSPQLIFESNPPPLVCAECSWSAPDLAHLSC